MRVGMHETELEGAALPSLRVRNPSREQKKRNKTFEKFTSNMAFIYSPPIYIKREHGEGTKKGTFLPTTKGSKGTEMTANMHVSSVKTC